MKRDWDLIRKIMIEVEALEDLRSSVEPEDIKGYDDEFVSYHIHLLIEAGFIEGECRKTLGEPLHCWAYRLTWEGHEFLDQIKAKPVWNKIKGLIRQKGLEMSIDVIRIASKQIIKEMF